MRLKKYSLALICCFMLLGLSAQTVSVKPGKIQVKLTPEAEQQLQMAERPLDVTGQNRPLSVGLKKIDAVNATCKASKMKRIFFIGGPFEERQRRNELHLWYEITVDEEAELFSVANAYLKTGEVEIAEPEYSIQHINEVSVPEKLASQNDDNIIIQSVSDDPEFNKQWHYNNTGQTTGGKAGIDIRLPNAWERTKGDPRVIVSVIDGGIQYDHPDLAGNMWPGIGQNFMYNGSGSVTPHSHGTHVAGIIAAVSNNGKGVAGVAGGWGESNPGARLMSCQIFEDGVSGGANTAAAIQYGADNGALISQNSWGYENPGVSNAGVRQAIQYFIENAGTDNNGNALPGTLMKGGIVIFAAGNNNSNRADWYPGMWPEVLCVASVGPTGKRAYYSNYGEAIDVTAPGGDVDISSNSQVMSTIPGNSYGYKQGTSMACPHVSGIAALVLSRLGSETYTPAMLWDRLVLAINPISDEPLYEDDQMGSGLIDASKAVADYVRVTNVSLPATDEVKIRRTITLTASLTPANATDFRLLWSSDDPAIASVNHKGIVTGMSDGSTTIRVTTNDGGYMAATSISVSPVHVERISVSPKTVELNIGASRRLSTIIVPTDATNKNLIWNSSNPNIVTVDEIGTISGISPGSATITVTTVDGAFSDNSIITVKSPITGISLDITRLQLVVGETAFLTPTITPADAPNKNVSWRSSNTGVVTVNPSEDRGEVYAGGVGTTVITVSTQDGNYEASCDVEVFNETQIPAGFSPNGDGINDYFELTLNRSDTYVLRVFDKSGQVHYLNSDYKNDWDGTASTGPHSGKKVPSGAYFYSLSAKKAGTTNTGYIIIRY